MEYLAAQDDGAEDTVKVVATKIDDPEEDSRTATFSLKCSKRASPEPSSVQDQNVTIEIDEPNRSAKRQKLEPAIEDVNKESLNQQQERMDQEHTYREWEEERTTVQVEPSTLTSATTRPRRVSKAKQQKMGTATSKKPDWQKLTKKKLQEINPSSGVSGSASMEGVEASMTAPRPTSSGNVTAGKKTRVRITGGAQKATLEEFEVLLTGFDHEPMMGFSGSKKKKKKDHFLIVTFPSRSEAQRAITELNGMKVRSKEVFLNYDSSHEKGAQAPQAPQLSKTPQARHTVNILSDEEGEIDESAPPEALVLPDTGSDEEIHQAELINGAAHQMAARLSKGRFKVDQTQQNFQEGTALLLSVAWPVGAPAAKQNVTREMLRKRLYGIIPFARYETVRTCFQPTVPKSKDPEKCIVVFRSPEATTAAEQYLQLKQFTEQDVNFTIEVDRSADIEDTAAGKPASWRVIPKGVDRESLAIGVAGAARKEIAQGMYTSNRFLSFGSNLQTPLFEEKAKTEKQPSKPEDVVSTVATRSMRSKVDNDASKKKSPSTAQNKPTTATSSSLTDLPIPIRSLMSQLSEHERKLQTKYNFIERDNEVVFCPLCNERGHMDETCSERTCKHCGAVNEHFDQFCPKYMKCSKCRERGHNEMECTSKLKRTAADGFECDICGREGHPEEQCPDHFVLMFKPPAEPNKVASLRVCCYVCASEQHYGDDCPDRMTMGRKRALLTDSMHVFSAAFANKFLTTPLPPAVRYHHRAAAASSRPPAGSSRGQGGRFASANGRDINNAIDLDMVQDSLDSLPRRAPPRNNIPPPPREAQPPLPPGPPPPLLSRRHPPPPSSRYESRNQNYRGSDGYVQYQGPSGNASYNNVPPPGSYQQPPRRRSRSPERRRGGGYMPPGRDYRDRHDGPQQQRMFPRGANNTLRGAPPQGPPGAPRMGHYGVHR